MPRSLAPGNCSHKIPASYNGTDIYVDPINWVIRPLGTTVHLPIAPLGIDEPTIQLGLGRSIYTDKQMKEFYAFQNAAVPEMLS